MEGKLSPKLETECALCSKPAQQNKFLCERHEKSVERAKEQYKKELAQK